MDLRYLENIGLTKSEAKVYLALLKLGESTTGPVVDEARISHSKIYDVLERLKQKGLASYIIKESTKYFSAASPDNLLSYLGEKEREIKSEKETIRDLINKLKGQYLTAIDKKIAEVFIGFNGMQNAFNVLINNFNSGEIYFAFGASKGENVEKIQTFFEKLHTERLKNKIKSKIIFNESSRGLFKSQERSKFVEARYLIESTPASINIYKNYTIIAVLLENPITFLIRNNEVADSFREYFNVMWKIAKR